MPNFKVDAYNADRTEVEQQYSLTTTDTTAASIVALNQVSPVGTITSGTLPDTGAWVSGTAKVNPVARDITVYVELVGSATNAIASCTIALSADNSTFTTVGTPSLAAAVNNTGAVTLVVPVRLPTGWYVKLTLSNFTCAASIYAQTVTLPDVADLTFPGGLYADPNAITKLSRFLVNAHTPLVTNSLVVKTSPGLVFGFWVSSVAAQFIQVFDAEALPADTAVPTLSFPVGATAGVGAAYTPVPRGFRNGIVFCNSSTQHTKTIAAADCIFDVQYLQMPWVSGGGGGAGAVTSVFTRAGQVVATAGDYTGVAVGGTADALAAGALTNAMVNATAAIAKTKLASLDVVNADVNAAAAIAKTKLASLDVVNADVNAAAAIAKTKLASLDVVNADVNASAAIAISKLADPTTGKVIGSASNAAAAVLPPGYEWDYVARTTNLSVTPTTPATAADWIIGNAVTYDGAAVVIVGYCAVVSVGAGGNCQISLYDGSTQIGIIGGATQSVLMYVSQRFTPSGGSHTYSLKVSKVGAPTVDMNAGAGTIGLFVPSFLRVTKV